MVNEPSVFEPLKFYCINAPLKLSFREDSTRCYCNAIKHSQGIALGQNILLGLNRFLTVSLNTYYYCISPTIRRGFPLSKSVQ